MIVIELHRCFKVIICFLQIEEVNILIARLEKYFAKIQVKEKEIADLEMKITTLSVTAIEELDKEYAFLTEKIDALTAEIDQLQKQNAATAVSYFNKISFELIQ